MKKLFKTIDPESISDNIFKLLDKDWMLITAGKKESYNTMTASWGGFGVLWHKYVCFAFVRPQRYTYQFMEREILFSLSFFTEEYREALEFCGRESGRKVDKAKACGLTPLETSPGIISFAEARLVIECRKIYYQDLNPKHFLDPSIDKNYPKKDYHRLYLGEVIRCLL